MSAPGAATVTAPAVRRRSWLARVIPRTLRERLRPAAAMPWPLRLVFLARWLSGAPRRRRVPVPVRRLLFVCHGNIIRSALAEALWRREAAALGLPVVVSSAGLHAKPGKPPDPRAVAAAGAVGVSLTGHAARPVSPDDVRAADLVLVMDYANDAELIARYPGAWRKVRLLGAFEGSEAVIPDPYARDAPAVQAAADRVARAVRALARRLGGLS